MSQSNALSCCTGTLYGDMVLAEGVFSVQTGKVKPVYDNSNPNEFPLVAYDPIGSGVNVKILRVSIAVLSGVMSPGTIFLGFGTNTASQPIISGQGYAPSQTWVGRNFNTPRVVIAGGFDSTNNGATVTPGPDQPAAYALGIMPACSASTATQPSRVTFDASGMFVLAPGTFMTLSVFPRPVNSMGIGFVTYGLTWVEEPVSQRAPFCPERPSSRGLEV